MKPEVRPETHSVISPPRPADQPSEPQAAEVLLPQVYEELRRLAACKMAQEPPGQTLQATALVHEAWLRLAAQDNQTYANRTHFFAVAAEAMRRILIDRARRRQAVRRGGQAQRVDTDALEVAAPVPDDELLALDEALERLAEHEPQKAELVKLRHFVGPTLVEAAEIPEISDYDELVARGCAAAALLAGDERRIVHTPW